MTPDEIMLAVLEKQNAELDAQFDRCRTEVAAWGDVELRIPDETLEQIAHTAAPRRPVPNFALRA